MEGIEPLYTGEDARHRGLKAQARFQAVDGLLRSLRTGVSSLFELLRERLRSLQYLVCGACSSTSWLETASVAERKAEIAPNIADSLDIRSTIGGVEARIG